jgi:hypothetical protein
MTMSSVLRVPLSVVLPVSLLVSVLGGYGIARVYAGKSGTTDIVKLEPKRMEAFAVDLKTPQQMTDLEGAATGGSLLGLDFLLDGELGILSVLGVAVAGLSWLFSPSLSTVQEQAIAELDGHITSQLGLEQRLEAIFVAPRRK